MLGQALTGTRTDPAWPSRLTEILQLLREHILKEQDGVFPAALAAWAPLTGRQPKRSARVGSVLPSTDG